MDYADLFQEVINRHGLTFKELANDNRFKFHVAERQIRKYAVGECEVPAWAWAALYDITKDVSIIEVIIGNDNNIVVVPNKHDNETKHEYARALRVSIESMTQELERLANDEL
jgi:porphobilinogen deaminase